MTIQEQYKAKKCSPEEAISHVKDHAGVFTGSEPILLFKALFDQRERFSDLHIYTMLSYSGRPVIWAEKTGYSTKAPLVLKAHAKRG